MPPTGGVPQLYYILNLQGDVVMMVDEDGSEVARYTYDPYGNILTATGTMAEINPLRYRGYYYDSETGFYYLQSRYYDPAIGRFINADSYASTGQGFIGFNMFAYCGNNPANHYDPSGHAYWGTNTVAINDGGYQLASGNDDYGDNDYSPVSISTNMVSKLTVSCGVIAHASYENIVGMTGAYSALRESANGSGYQVHHIIEWRFHPLANLAQNPTGYYSSPCIIVTRDQHQVYTNHLRKLYPYGKTDYAALNPEQVKNNFIAMYKQYGQDLDLDYIESIFK